jgi:hypothetical protein
MINALRHLTGRDKRALAVFFGIALLCALYFASGILVTYVSSPPEALEMAKDGAGYIVQIRGLQNFAMAEQLSSAIREQRRVKTVIEANPADLGYLINVGPLAKRESAEGLSSELLESGYTIVKVIENCPPGGDCGRNQPTPLPSVPAQRKSGQ